MSFGAGIGQHFCSSHARPVGVIAHHGSWYFTSGPTTRKSRNLARDRRCVVSVATDQFDLVLEGVAERISDAGELDSVAAAFVLRMARGGRR